MITDINYYKKVGKRLFTFVFTLLALYIIFKLSIFYIPFLIAFIISLIIEPLIKKVMRITNLTRKISAIITLIIVFCIIIGLLICGITVLITEMTTILENLNNNMETIERRISSLISRVNVDNIKVPAQMKTIIQNSANGLTGEGKNILQQLLSNTINIVKNIPKIMIYVGITIVATYFVCADKMYILDQMEHHLPRNWVNKFRIQIKKSNFFIRRLFKSRSNFNINIFYDITYRFDSIGFYRNEYKISISYSFIYWFY